MGKTSLVYHLAWMYADLGLNVVAADLDPQANLTSMFLEDERLEALWTDDGHKQTIYGAFQPLLEGTGDVAAPHVEDVSPGLSLVAGDLTLSAAEDELSGQWPDCLDRKSRAFRVLSGMWRILLAARERVGADLVLIDVGPNLGALNRAALVAADLCDQHIAKMAILSIFSAPSARLPGLTRRARVMTTRHTRPRSGPPAASGSPAAVQLPR